MIPIALRRRVLQFVVGFTLVTSAGCARTATFRVTHPAMINAAAVGNTMTVGPFEPNGFVAEAEEIRSDLANRIMNSLNRNIRLLESNGGIVITGAILTNEYQENITRDERTCTRRVVTGRDEQGRELTALRSYPCANLTRHGHANSRIQFRVTVGSTGQVIFDRIYERTKTQQTTGRESPYADENSVPDAIDGQAMLHNLRREITEEFSRVILPWQEEVSVEFEDCAGDPRCTNGYEAAKRGDLATADAWFTQVIGPYSRPNTPVPPEQTERIGEALFNRGLVRGYMGRYAQAVADITRAIALRPGHDRWTEELRNVQSLARDQEALRAQGAITAETQEIQQAGTP